MKMCQDRLMDLIAISVEVEESVHLILKELINREEVLSILLSRMCQDRFWTWMTPDQRKVSIIHVDLEEIETERNIVHVHEDLMIKSTVRVWSLHYSVRLWLMFLCSELRFEWKIPPPFSEIPRWNTLGRITRGVSPSKVTHVDFHVTRPCFQFPTFRLLSWGVINFGKIFIVCLSNITHTHISHSH